MPSSRPDTIPTVLSLVMSWHPQSILDGGAGVAKWGVLFREYLEVWQGRLGRETWRHQIDACEVHEPYVKAASPLYEYAYDQVFLLDVREVDVGGYDLLFLGDTIEHLPRPDALSLLKRACDYLVVTPLYDSQQGPVFGNEQERHLSCWEAKDFLHSTVVSGRYLVAWSRDG